MRIITDVRHLLGGDGASVKALASARWELVRVLREYQLFKHVEIFDPVIAHAGKYRASVAVRLKARCIELADAYGDHVRRWSLQGPVSAWSDYRQDAIAMCERILQQLEAEAAEVRKLLAEAGRTRAKG